MEQLLCFWFDEISLKIYTTCRENLYPIARCYHVYSESDSQTREPSLTPFKKCMMHTSSAKGNPALPKKPHMMISSKISTGWRIQTCKHREAACS